MPEPVSKHARRFLNTEAGEVVAVHGDHPPTVRFDVHGWPLPPSWTPTDVRS